MIKCLDKGHIRLCDSMPVSNGDLSIVRAARVSYDAAWRAGEDKGSDARLINYLWMNNHTSPFESVEFQFEVKAPIFVFRQWHRHRTWSISEVSARYTELPDEYYIPELNKIGVQSKENKQVRDLDASNELNLQALDDYISNCETSFRTYKSLLNEGWPRELARMVLPLSTYSHMFAKVNLKNLLHFISLRDHPHSQYEIRVFAQAMLELIEPIVPVTVSVYRKNKNNENLQTATT